MTQLCGKGIWLAHSYDLQRAAEMATRIGGTHVLVKVGHGPHYFPDTTREMVQRVRALGLYPLAWVKLTARAPQEARTAIVAALERGYEAVVLVLNPEAGAGPITGAQMQPLVQALINVEIPRQRLFLASPPLSYLSDRTAVEVLVQVCQGGWFPLCFAAWAESPTEVIDQGVYHGLGDLSLIWEGTPEVYPVLSAHYGLNDEALMPESFIPWVEGIARHGVDFFSVYDAAGTEKALWSMLEAINVACLETDGRVPVSVSDNRRAVPNASGQVPQPIYITVRTSDSVWGIISRHGISREQFWAWNAHLWDSRGLPRDPDYLQEGWRLRVK